MDNRDVVMSYRADRRHRAAVEKEARRLSPRRGARVSVSSALLALVEDGLALRRVAGKRLPEWAESDGGIEARLRDYLGEVSR